MHHPCPFYEDYNLDKTQQGTLVICYSLLTQHVCIAVLVSGEPCQITIYAPIFLPITRFFQNCAANIVFLLLTFTFCAHSLRELCG